MSLTSAVSIPDAQKPGRLTSGVSVRLLSSFGIYPSRIAFRRRDAAIVARPDLLALMTKFHPITPPEEHYFSEVEMLSAFEVRVLAAVILSRTRYSGGFEIYPTEVGYQTCDPELDLSRKDVLNALAMKLKSQLASCACESIHRPPCAGGRAYEMNPYATFSRKRFGQFLDLIDVNNHLLVRGLGALIKAGMLFRHREFLEQACMSLWISLDASFQLFRREMAAKGHQNPSGVDVGNYLDSLLGNAPTGERYSAAFYEERVKTMHPESKFGVYPAAPLCADEYDQLLASLIPTYEYLIVGRIPPRVVN